MWWFYDVLLKLLQNCFSRIRKDGRKNPDNYINILILFFDSGHKNSSTKPPSSKCVLLQNMMFKEQSAGWTSIKLAKDVLNDLIPSVHHFDLPLKLFFQSFQWNWPNFLNTLFQELFPYITSFVSICDADIIKMNVLEFSY